MVARSGATFAQDKVFSVTTSPAENTKKGMNISWATDKAITTATVEIARTNDANWKNSRKEVYNGEYCATFDNQYSKLANGQNFYEDVKISKYNAFVGKLKRNASYKYRVIAGGDTSDVHYFKLSGRKRWEACVISDFHAYSPLYGRTKSAMEMISTVEK